MGGREREEIGEVEVSGGGGVRREGWRERSGERGGVGEGEMERWKMREEVKRE